MVTARGPRQRSYDPSEEGTMRTLILALTLVTAGCSAAAGPETADPAQLAGVARGACPRMAATDEEQSPPVGACPRMATSADAEQAPPLGPGPRHGAMAQHGAGHRHGAMAQGGAGHGHGAMAQHGAGHRHGAMAQDGAAASDAAAEEPIVGAGGDAAERGRAIFVGRGNCSSCHGRDARGTAVAPDLTDGTWLHTDGTEAGIRLVVARGVAQPKVHAMPMPPMGGARLTEGDIEDLAAWIAAAAD